MTPEQRLAGFLREQIKLGKAWDKARRAGIHDIERVLARASRHVRKILTSSPTEWQSYHYKQLQRSLQKAMEETALELKKTAEFHYDIAKGIGQSSLDLPLAATGFNVSLLAPTVDTRQLSAMRAFMTDRMENITAKAVEKINGNLGLVISGAMPRHDAVNAIALLLNGNRGRALTVMRTEMGRAYSMATHERSLESKQYVPGLKKQWQGSGKRHPRMSHFIVIGQIKNIDEPYIVDGEELMYPRDPKGSMKNTINCGCDSLPYCDSWNISSEFLL